MGNESTAVQSEVDSKMSDQNIDCCPEICDKIQEVTKLSKDLSEMAKALNLSKDALSKKGKEISYFSDICANENIGQAVNNVSDSITPNGIQTSVNDGTKNGSEFAIAQTSKLVNGMREFAVDSKSKISSGMDLIINSFPSTISHHTANGILVGLVSDTLAAHAYSQNKKSNHD